MKEMVTMVIIIPPHANRFDSFDRFGTLINLKPAPLGQTWGTILGELYDVHNIKC